MPFTPETWSQPASPASSTDGEAGQHHTLTVPQPRSRPSISQKQKPVGKARKPEDAPGSEASHPEQGRKVERQHTSCSGTGGRDGVGSRAAWHRALAVPVSAQSWGRVWGSSAQGGCSQWQCRDGCATVQNPPAALCEERDEGICTQTLPRSTGRPQHMLSTAICVPPSSYIATTDLLPARCLIAHLTQTKSPSS